MPFIVVLAGILGLTWVLKEWDYIIPATVALILMLIVTAINPGVAVFMLMAMAALIVVSIVIAFLPQVLGFIIGVFILLACLAAAGSAHAGEQSMDRDTCGEIISDIAEYNYYAEGWKDVQPPRWDTDIRIIVFKKDREAELTCKDGWMRMEERQHQVQLQTEIKPAK